MASSTLFAGYRTVGLVVSPSRPHFYTLGDAVFLAAPIGNAYQVYDCAHLNVALVSKQVSHEITHVACHREYTFAATAVGIVVFHRGRPLRTLSSTSGVAPDDTRVVALLVLGEVLLALYAAGTLRVWRVAAAIAELPDGAPESSPSPMSEMPLHCAPTCMLHPDTYVNKVVVGTAEGALVIVNFATQRIVHTCNVCPGVPITCVAGSDVIDVIGAGTADGRAIVHHLKADIPVCSFRHAGADGAVDGAAISAMAFTRNNSLPHPTLVTANESGSVALWNLTSRMLQVLLPAAHDASIMLCAWIPGQPCFLTAGEDNHVCVWQVDKFDGQPRHLRSRSGHAAPPRLVRYYAGASVASLATGASATACEVASAGTDRALRCFHTALDRQNCELSQGSIRSRAKELGVHPNTLRLPMITAMAVSDRRYGQWSDVVTAHAGDYRAYLWSWENKRMDEHVLALKNEAEIVTAVAISACGNAAVLGGSLGTITQFNLQSGARRGNFPRAPEGDGPLRSHGRKRRAPHEVDIGAPDRNIGKGKSRGNRLGLIDSVDSAMLRVMGIGPQLAATDADKSASLSPHDKQPIYGLAVDGMNSCLVAADGAGVVSFWEYGSRKLRGTTRLPSSVLCATCQRDSNLFAVACDDFVIRVLDIVTRMVIRTYSAHTNRVTDLAFSPDGRWLASASLDRSIRLWDLPAARCIDWLSFDHAAMSITFSPTSEFLISAHEGELGIRMWANKAHFGSSASADVPDAPYEMSAPDAAATAPDPEDAASPVGMAVADNTAGDDGPQDDSATSDSTRRKRRRSAASADEAAVKPDCRFELSGVPASVVMNITRLDVIAARNKPTAAPEKPADAPFFLPTVAGLKPTFAVGPTAPAPEGADPAAVGDGDASVPGSKLVRGDASSRLRSSRLVQLLRACATTGQDDVEARTQTDAVAAYLRDLPASGVDAEIRSLCLGAEDAAGVAALSDLATYFAHALRLGVAADLTQAQLQLTLQVYQDILPALPELQASLRTLAALLDEQAADTNARVDKCLCMLSTFLGQA